GYRPFPERKLRFRVEHPPAAVGEDKRLHSSGEHLDLLVWAEHQADMAAGPRGQRMKHVNPGTRNRENRLRLRLILTLRSGRLILGVGLVDGPVPDVHQIGEPALLVHEKDRSAAVAESVQRL